MSPSFLLLQARDEGDPMLAQERRCFSCRLDVPEDRIETHNLVAGPPTLSRALEARAVFVGGSGEYLVSRGNLPRFDATLDFLSRLVETDQPMFASCFGFQCLVEALGGRIVYDAGRAEVGTFEIALTEEGRSDPLLGRLPARFAAQQGHKDRAVELPPAAIHLAASERSPFQAFRLRGKRVWATQFHPELTRHENRERYERYLHNYRGEIEDDCEDEERFRDSHETERLLPDFVRRYAS